MFRIPRRFRFHQPPKQPAVATPKPVLDYEAPPEEVEADADRPWWKAWLGAFFTHFVIEPILYVVVVVVVAIVLLWLWR